MDTETEARTHGRDGIPPEADGRDLRHGPDGLRGLAIVHSWYLDPEGEERPEATIIAPDGGRWDVRSGRPVGVGTMLYAPSARDLTTSPACLVVAITPPDHEGRVWTRRMHGAGRRQASRQVNVSEAYVLS